jgi:hypothetical protein
LFSGESHGGPNDVPSPGEEKERLGTTDEFFLWATFAKKNKLLQTTAQFLLHQVWHLTLNVAVFSDFYTS